MACPPIHKVSLKPRSLRYGPADMAMRLNGIQSAFRMPPFDGNDNTSASSSTGTAPVPIPGIHTESELADFNRFMLSLGQHTQQQHHVAGVGANLRPSPSNNNPTSYLATSNSPYSSSSPTSDMSGSDMFDPQSLAQLGLGNMPGFNIPQSAAQNNQQNTISYSSLYPSLDDLPKSHHNRTSSEGSSHSSQNRQIAPLPNTRRAAGPLASFEQAISYPPLSALQNGSMINARATDDNHFEQTFSGNFNFDILAKSTGIVPEATISPMSTAQNKYRNVDMLGASMVRPTSAARSSLDILSEACEDAAAELAAQRETHQTSSPLVFSDEPEVYDVEIKGESPPLLRHHLLSEKDAGSEFKLPALKPRRTPRGESLYPIRQLGGDARLLYRSSPRKDSQDSGSSMPSTACLTPNQDSRDCSPDIHALERHASHDERSAEVLEEHRRREDMLVGGVDKIDLGKASGGGLSNLVQQGRDHANLIRDIIVAVNNDWKRRHRMQTLRSLDVDIKGDDSDLRPLQEEMTEERTPSTPTRRSFIRSEDQS